MVPPSLLAGVVAPPLVAHQGGWDEILMVAVPVGLFAFLLYAANKRATRLAEERDDATPTGETTQTDAASASDDERVDERATGAPPRPRGPI